MLLPRWHPVTSSLFLALGIAGSAQAASISLVQDGQFFKGWVFSDIPAPPSPPGNFNCQAPPTNLPATAQIQGTLGEINYTVSADASPATVNWQVCPWIVGKQIPSGNALPAHFTGSSYLGVGSVNYSQGNFDIKADKPFVPGTLLAFQDMDGWESADLTFRSCSGAVIDPVNFDTLLLSSNYVPDGTTNGIPMPTSTYVPAAGGNPPGWRMASYVWTSGIYGGLPNTASGILLNAPGICSIRLVGPTKGTSGGVTFYLAAPPPVPVAPVPALGSAGLLALAGLLGAAALHGRRRT